MRRNLAFLTQQCFSLKNVQHGFGFFYFYFYFLTKKQTASLGVSFISLTTKAISVQAEHKTC